MKSVVAHITCVLLLLVMHNTKAQTIPDTYYYTIRTADSLRSLKQYREAAQTYSAAFARLNGKGLLNDRYNAACCWAMAQSPDSAFAHLERLVTAGNYANIRHISTDKDFESLHPDKRWQPLLEKVKQNKARLNNGTNDELVDLIDSMEKQDQKWRLLMRDIGNKKADSLAQPEILRQMLLTDSLNYFVLQKIVRQYGFPNYKLVGPGASHYFWLLMQHQDRHPEFQDSVLKLMKIEVDRGQALPSNYAYLLDRVKLNTGQLQVYGTQMQLNADKTSYEPKPVIEPEKLNERRLAMGMSPIEDYIASMNQSYFGTLKK